MRYLWVLAVVFLGGFTAPVHAQSEEEDKGRITEYLEEVLSGLGREVRIDGFRGALSSRVSMDRLTVADGDGVWLTLTDAVLDWNRASILRGRINITQISAATVEIARPPVADDEGASPEASGGFSLPELPVSIDIQALDIKEVILGAPILGDEVTLRVQGAVTLEDGEGQAQLNVERLGGPRGLFELAGSYANETRQLAVDLSLDEAQDGLAATLLNLPGRPALQLTVKGDAPIDEFVAEIGLKSDGQDRLTGRVSTQLVSAEGNPAPEDEPLPRIILVDIAGDLAPLFAPAYQPFFGNDVGLQSLVRLFPDGRVSLETLKFSAAALVLEGSLDMAANGLPERFDFRGLMEDPGGALVTLPVSGAGTFVRRADITAQFDASEGDAWILKATLDDFERPDLALDRVELGANGTIAEDAGRAVTARLDSFVRGITLADEALAQAIGNAITLTGDITWQDGQPIALRDIELAGEGMAVTADGRVDGLESGVTWDGRVQAEIADIARLSGLAGRPLAGEVKADLTGLAAALTGAFDLELDATGRDLSVGIDKLDAALAGDTVVALSAKRDETGLTLRDAAVTTPSARVQGSGALASDQSRVAVEAALDDIGQFLDNIAGAVTVKATGVQEGDMWQVKTTATGPGGSAIDVAGLLGLKDMREPKSFDGRITASADDLSAFAALAGRPLAGGLQATAEGAAYLETGFFDLELDATGKDLRVGIDQVDMALAGDSTLVFAGKRDASGVTVNAARLSTPLVTASGNGTQDRDIANFDFAAAVEDVSRFVNGMTGRATVEGQALQDSTGWVADLDATGPLQSSVSGRLTLPKDGEPGATLEGVIGNVAALIPELPGSAQFKADLQQQGEVWQVKTTGQGPGGSTFDVAGDVQADASRASLDIDGTLPLALANRSIAPNAAQGTAEFDLRLDGPLAASSVSGRLSTAGARVALPSLQNALTDINATIDLSGARADVQTTATLATGGQLNVSGNVGTAAPISTNLAIQIRNATLRDPKLFETAANGDLVVTGTAPSNMKIAGQVLLDRTEVRVPSGGLGAGAIPDITHVNEPRGVRQTRQVAGLIPDPEEESGGGGPGIGLDVLVIADNKVFVRGRGLDAELGGRFRVTGTTSDIIPIGGIDLIRGRLDILGKRLNMDEGIIRLTGDFIPGLRFVASTVSDDDTLVRIIIEGRADAPEVSFTSEPSLPEDEVLARLLFGRDLGSLSAFQALQLASAVATLAGRGGTSLAERLRQSTGLDDVSVSTDSEGQATVGVGKYISDNIYTDVQIGDEQNTEINLNIDLSRRTKVRGSFGSDGSTGVGIFFEKDY